MTAQPEWDKTVLSDSEILYVDKTGVYDPELLVAEELSDEKFVVYRFPIEKCFSMGGKVSDNKFHKDHVAWFGTPEHLRSVSKTCDIHVRDLIKLLCSDDPIERSRAYIDIGGYFGFDEFDSYPETLTDEELEEYFR